HDRGPHRLRRLPHPALGRRTDRDRRPLLDTQRRPEAPQSSVCRAAVAAAQSPGSGRSLPDPRGPPMQIEIITIGNEVLSGRPLQLDEKVLAHVRERARASRRRLPASIEAQALLPRGAEAWENPVGTAPALCMLQRGRPVILLPGVPNEMERLAVDYVVPYLR